jgi:hypothetical protein
LQANVTAMGNAITTKHKNWKKKAITAIAVDNIVAISDDDSSSSSNSDSNDNDDNQDVEQIEGASINPLPPLHLQRQKELFKQILQKSEDCKVDIELKAVVEKESKTAAEKEAVTTFSKPSKQQKRKQLEFKFSNEQQQLEDFFLDDNIEASFPIEKDGEDIVVAEYFIWKAEYLHKMKKTCSPCSMQEIWSYS